jgi:hypothetical protein
MWFDGLYFLGVFRSSDKSKNAGLTPFLGTKKAPKRGQYTGDRGITTCIRAAMIAFMTKSGSMWFDASNDNGQQHIYI